MLKRPLRYAIKPWAESCGLGDKFTFYSPRREQAEGYRDDGSLVAPKGGLCFPALATGGRCPPDAYAAFLWHLAKAHSRRADNLALGLSRP